MNRKLILSNIAVVLLFLVGVAYLLVGVVRINPLADPMTVTVELHASGGLLDNSQVSYNGHPVGKVEQIRLRPGGVLVDVRLEEGTQIPVDTEAVVANLSAAGEQYLDFKPRTDAGPYLADGDVVEESETSTPISFAQLMTNVDKLASQLDTRKLNVIVDELAMGFDGTDQDLRDLIVGSSQLLATLQDLFPETVRLLNNGAVVLDTAVELTDDLGRFSRSARTFAKQLHSSDPTIRQFFDDAPGAMGDIEEGLQSLQPGLTALLTDFVPLSRLLAERLPALSLYLPELQWLAETLPHAVSGGVLHGMGDPEPRKTCDYGTPRVLPTVLTPEGPYLYRYCTEYDPRMQQRGAYYAPRPPGDGTAHAPAGVNGLERLWRD